MTVLEWTTRGGLRGRCDETCHRAEDSRCTCFCGGYLHGIQHRPGGLEGIDVSRWTSALNNARIKAKFAGALLKWTVPPLQLDFLGLIRS
jgi:hypothetical protein